MELLRLWALNMAVTVRNLVEFCKTVVKYYTNREFRRVDWALLKKYRFNSPFRISKEFLSETGADDIYTYGETPLTSLQLIAAECGIGPGDCVFELGCGRGRTCFWLHAFCGCRVVGVEIVPFFVEAARQVKDECGVNGIDFRLDDILKCDLTGATVVYLYGTCYDEQFIFALSRRLGKLPRGTRIITVSYSLEEFGATDFELVRCFPVKFTWGTADVYLQVRK